MLDSGNCTPQGTLDVLADTFFCSVAKKLVGCPVSYCAFIVCEAEVEHARTCRCRDAFTFNVVSQDHQICAVGAARRTSGTGTEGSVENELASESLRLDPSAAGAGLNHMTSFLSTSGCVARRFCPDSWRSGVVLVAAFLSGMASVGG